MLFRFRHLIPVTFLTGFYVTQVVTRYWDQFMSLPYTDILALKLVSFMPGHVGAKSSNKTPTSFTINRTKYTLHLGIPKQYLI